MERILRPERLETDPNASNAAKEWAHWIRTFENFVEVLPTPSEGELDKLSILVLPTSYRQESMKLYQSALPIKLH